MDGTRLNHGDDIVLVSENASTRYHILMSLEETKWEPLAKRVPSVGNGWHEHNELFERVEYFGALVRRFC